MKDNLKKIAHRMVELEKEIKGQPTEKYWDEMAKWMLDISIKDMIEIDNYIQEKNYWQNKNFVL